MKDNLIGNCKHCVHAIWDYIDYEDHVGDKMRRWFVTGCWKHSSEEGCKEFEEEVDD